MDDERYSFHVMGGIGDIILCHQGINQIIDDFGPQPECHVFSHFPQALDLVAPFGERLGGVNMYYYTDNSHLVDQYSSVLRELEANPYHLGDAREFGLGPFPLIETPMSNRQEALRICPPKQCRLIGVHPFGSEFSNEWIENKLKHAGKNLDLEWVTDVIMELYREDEATRFVLFGAGQDENEYIMELVERLDMRGINIIEHVYTCVSVPIMTALFLASVCDVVLASDSAIKAYVAAKEGKCVVLVGDYVDDVRDVKFLDPYTSHGNMKVVKYSEFDDKVKKETVDGILHYLSNPKL